MEPHVWHSPQRPAHFVVCQPHSEHWKSTPGDDLAMAGTVSAGSDIASRARRDRWSERGAAEARAWHADAVSQHKLAAGPARRPAPGTGTRRREGRRLGAGGQHNP